MLVVLVSSQLQVTRDTAMTLSAVARCFPQSLKRMVRQASSKPAVSAATTSAQVYDREGKYAAHSVVGCPFPDAVFVV